MSPTRVSRPEALENPPQEMEIDPKGKAKPSTQPEKSGTVVALAPLSRRASESRMSARAETSAVTGNLAPGQGQRADKNDGSGDRSDVPLPPRRQTAGATGAASADGASSGKAQSTADKSPFNWLTSLIR